ncbi:MAG: CmpA/NrtA family ABC transporter substrate-binding protein [Pseudomonadota bacterium]|nr:CmpA/NrtA family ABC transporter substrate-binding protein [Pseudomonadota bacterium]
MSTVEVNIGYLPLTDSALLVAASERGFAEEEGIALRLLRETSWANIRDRMSVGHFEAAHLLAPMPIAAALGLWPLQQKVYAPMALGLGGNAVTVSRALFEGMSDELEFSVEEPATAGSALRRLIDRRANGGARKLQFGVVHEHSGHNFDLRYWLSASGITPDAEVTIVVIPPAYLPDALESGQIDGYCVGEPWNTVAVARGVGHIVTTKSAIWKSSPEKVLGVRAEWIERQPEAASALIRAIYRAAKWCGDDNNTGTLVAILARPEYLNQPVEYLLPGLDNSIVAGSGASKVRFFEPVAHAATFPWQSHALWFYSQMVRWGQVEHSASNAELARRSFRPDLYRTALRSLSEPVPVANAKVEGALKESQPVGVSQGTLNLGPDGFFDGRIFDPDRLDEYLVPDSGA